MQTLTVELAERAYPIYIGDSLLSQPSLILPHLPAKQVAIITNTTVAPLYLDAFSAGLRDNGVTVVPVILPDGESYKNSETLNHIYDVLLDNHCERKTTLIALGGGVIGDLTGFAAATFLRGVPFIQVPTTLLAQVDSSVGGKTGINHPRGKNMIGAFYQPKLVLADTATLNSLPDRELSAGIAEIIKYGLIRDAAFFQWLEDHMTVLLARDPEVLATTIVRSCRNKAEVVVEDELEGGCRVLLNLGHTFGHAIETGMGYGHWLHGEAVAAGTMLAADLSRRMGILSDHDVARIRRLYQAARLPVAAPDLGEAVYHRLMAIDKKVAEGKVCFVLLKAIGETFLSADVPADVLTATLRALAA